MLTLKKADCCAKVAR